MGAGRSVNRPRTRDPAQVSFDHVVIVVPRLDAAIANFQALGFQVQRAGTYALRSHKCSTGALPW